MVTNAASKGEVSLYADAGCGKAFKLNYTISADVCGTPSKNEDDWNSYLVTQRPTCSNGTVADWVIYRDLDCKDEYSRLKPDDQFDVGGPGFGPDDICLAMAPVSSLAFVCDGVGHQRDESGGPVPISPSPSSDFPSSVTSSAASTDFATPIAPGTSRPSALYSVPAGSSLPSSVGTFPIGTAASTGSTPSTTRFLSPIYTGVATKVGASVAGTMAFVGAALIL